MACCFFQLRRTFGQTFSCTRYSAKRTCVRSQTATHRISVAKPPNHQSRMLHWWSCTTTSSSRHSSPRFVMDTTCYLHQLVDAINDVDQTMPTIKKTQQILTDKMCSSSRHAHRSDMITDRYSNVFGPMGLKGFISVGVVVDSFEGPTLLFAENGRLATDGKNLKPLNP